MIVQPSATFPHQRRDLNRRSYAITLAGYVVLWLLSWTAAHPLTVFGATLLAAIGVAGNMVALYSFDAASWWCSPLFWFTVACFLIFVIRPWADLAVQTPPYQFDIPIEASYAQAIELGALGIFFTGVGFGLSIVFGSYSREPKTSATAAVDPRRLVVGVWTSIVVVLLLTAAFLVVSGGLSVFLSGRTSATSAAFDSSSGYLYSAPQWLFPIGLYLVVAKPHEGGGIFPRWLGWVLVASSQFIGLLLGDRSYFLVALFAATISIMLVKGKSPNLFVVSLLIPVIVVAGVVFPRLYRGEGSGDVATAAQESQDEFSSDGWYSFLLSDDFAMSRDLALVLRVVPDEVGYTYGSTYLAAIARPVPRVFFSEGKPAAADTILNEIAIYQFTTIEAGFSYSFVSEPLLNFGLPGVIVFSLALGAALFYVQVWFERRAGSRRSSDAIFYAVTAISTINLARGNLGTDYPRLLFLILPLWLLLWFAREAKGSARLEGVVVK